ncbi:MAG: dephospho-CoA kinase [Saprospiraceae bacterium]
MYKIGITGGIGSGKTTVSKIFEAMGIPVYNADSKAKYLMTSDEELIDNIKKLLGENSYFDNGELNRKYISDIIFNDKPLLDKMNNIVHPAVQQNFIKWSNEQTSPYVIKEAAILFESGSYKDLDFIILVTAPIELRIERVCKRDNITNEKVQERINNQMPDSQKIKLSDFIIINDGKHSLINQIMEVHKQILKLSGQET